MVEISSVLGCRTAVSRSGVNECALAGSRFQRGGKRVFARGAPKSCAKAFEILRDPGLVNREGFGTIETIETIIFAPFPSPDYHRGKWSEGD